MAARKTAAQKAAEAAEREEYTGIPEHPAEDTNEKDKADLTDVVDDKGKRLTVQQLKNKLRNEAEREVLDTHKPEVIAITEAKYKKHGLEYVRRLTEPEKAAKEIGERLAQFPELAALFIPTGTLVYTDVNGDPEPPAESYADVEDEDGVQYEEDLPPRGDFDE